MRGGCALDFSKDWNTYLLLFPLLCSFKFFTAHLQNLSCDWLVLKWRDGSCWKIEAYSSEKFCQRCNIAKNIAQPHVCLTALQQTSHWLLIDLWCLQNDNWLTDFFLFHHCQTQSADIFCSQLRARWTISSTARSTYNTKWSNLSQSNAVCQSLLMFHSLLQQLVVTSKPNPNFALIINSDGKQLNWIYVTQRWKKRKK